MVRRDGAEVRRDRIQKIAQYTLRELQKSKNGWIMFNRHIAFLMLEHGLTREKLIEYLGICQEVGYFEIDVDNNKIKTIQV